MNKRTLGSLHRWIFILMGLFMLVWLFSGIVMVLPHYWFGGNSSNKQPALDYHNITLSPADAVSRLEQHVGSDLEVKHIKLNQIQDDLYYTIRANGNISGLISGTTGKPFSFPPELAETVTRRNFGIEAKLLESTRLTEHTSTYPYGHLPVYLLRFEDNPGHYYYVNENNAGVSRSTPLSRLYNGIGSLHAFDPLETLTGSKALRMGTLLITGIASLVGSIIGVLLIFPLRRKRVQSTN